jgi:hypothetical protein
VALVVEAPSARPSGDLLELPVGEEPGGRAVVLAELGEQHSADRHVDAHAERVGPADHLEQAGLGQLLHEQPVAGEQPGMVQSDPVADEAPQVLADRGVEAEAADLGTYGGLLVFREHVEAAQVLGLLCGGLLGEVHDVDGCPVGPQQFVDRLVERGLPVLGDERHGSLAAGDGDGRSAGAGLEVVGEAPGRPERGGHQQELHVGQFEQRHLPGPAPLRVGVEVELVGHDQAHVDVGALA